MKNSQFIFCSILILIISGCASAPVMTLDNLVNGNLAAITYSSEISLDEVVKGVLDESDPVIVMNKTCTNADSDIHESEPYYTPFDINKLSLNKGSYTINYISLGNMLGFNKTFMLPMISIVDSKGMDLPFKTSSLSVINAPGISDSASAECYFSFTIDAAQDVYIIVHSDLTPIARDFGWLWGYFGNAFFPLDDYVFFIGCAFSQMASTSRLYELQKQLEHDGIPYLLFCDDEETLFFKRSPFAKYRITVKNGFLPSRLDEYPKISQAIRLHLDEALKKYNEPKK